MRSLGASEDIIAKLPPPGKRHFFDGATLRYDIAVKWLEDVANYSRTYPLRMSIGPGLLAFRIITCDGAFWLNLNILSAVEL